MNMDNIRRAASLFACLLLFVGISIAQTATGTLRGQVTDQLGAVVRGATVTAIDATGNERAATTNDDGNYTIAGVTPGVYLVRVNAPGFAQFENSQVEVAAGKKDLLDIQLGVSLEEEQVTVAGDAPVSTEPANNADALVLRGADLDALPDDPDDLEAALQALAGPSAGPNGGQLFIDGFTGGRLPPKESIREIRINSNPFSAEYDRPGFGRIEILTRPGTDKFRGTAFFNFGDESLNSRNPFAVNRDGTETKRAPYQQKRFGGNVSGSLVPKRASYFFDFERRDIDDNTIINARVLDSAFNEQPFNLAIVTPQRRTTFSPRFDYQINTNNTLVGRYAFTRRENINVGLDEFTLPERAYNSESTEHTFQLTETAVISTVVNETRFQYSSENRSEDASNALPTINVLDAFISGSPFIGANSRNPEKRFELQNYTSFALGNHSIKIGGRLRRTSILDFSPDNYAGSFLFLSLDQYRATLLGNARPAQFTVAAGNPEASVKQIDFGAFIQDDWRYSPALTLSLGLRYETQSNISSNLNFAPRLGFAYSPGANASGGRAKTVIRGGFGIFYERFAESLVLQSRRFNAVGEDGTLNNVGDINQLQFIIRDPDFFTGNIPTTEQLFNQFGVQGLTTRRVADDLSAPYSMQTSFSVERQLFGNVSLSVRYNNTRTRHVLRSRNINAPLPESLQYTGDGRLAVDDSGRPVGALYPFGAVGNIYQYESSGVFNQNQLLIFTQSRFSRRATFFGGYILGSSKSDTEGAGSFPANTYDLSTEYGRSSFDVRHRFFASGSFNAPFGITLNPFVTASSARPFNITTGQDRNGDAQFNDRPAFATDFSRASVRRTQFGDFDINPLPGAEIIPRNYGQGSSFFSVNLRVGRTFGFGKSTEAASAQNTGDAGGGGRRGGGGGGRGGFPGGGGGRGGFGDSSSDSRYTLNLSVQVQNLFNRNNLGQPVGNLNSSRFGQSTSTVASFGGFGGGGGGNIAAGNRRVEAQLRFSF